MKILLYGGAFNPVHDGHREALAAACAAVEPDRVLVMPTGLHPLGKELVRFEHRRAMCELALAGVAPCVEVSSLEYDAAVRTGVLSYTVDTVQAVKKENPDSVLYLLLGADAIRSDCWDPGHWVRIRRMARLVVCSRLGHEVRDVDMLPYDSVQVAATLEMSSTAVRAHYGEGATTRYPGVCEAVHEYVLEHRLYGVAPRAPDGSRVTYTEFGRDGRAKAVATMRGEYTFHDTPDGRVYQCVSGAGLREGMRRELPTAHPSVPVTVWAAPGVVLTLPRAIGGGELTPELAVKHGYVLTTTTPNLFEGATERGCVVRCWICGVDRGDENLCDHVWWSTEARDHMGPGHEGSPEWEVLKNSLAVLLTTDQAAALAMSLRQRVPPVLVKDRIEVQGVEAIDPTDDDWSGLRMEEDGWRWLKAIGACMAPHRSALLQTHGYDLVTRTAETLETIVEEAQPRVGYHVRKIRRGEVGEASKLREELEEFEDALEQGNPVMALVELADLLLATELWLQRHHPSMTVEDLRRMAAVTRRAFESGARSARQ